MSVLSPLGWNSRRMYLSLFSWFGSVVVGRVVHSAIPFRTYHLAFFKEIVHINFFWGLSMKTLSYMGDFMERNSALDLRLCSLAMERRMCGGRLMMPRDW